MGKIPKATKKRSRYNPIERKVNHEPDRVEGLDVIYNKLTSSNAQEYLPFLRNLEALSSESLGNALKILQYKRKDGIPHVFLHKLLPFLTPDTKINHQLAVAGILRNLSSYDNEECIDILMKSKILKQLFNLLCSAPSHQESDKNLLLVEQISLTIYNVCDVRGEGMEHLERLVPRLVLYATKKASKTSLAANLALLKLSEDNDKVEEYLEKSISRLEDCAAVGLSSQEPTERYNSLVIAGTLINIGHFSLEGNTLGTVSGLIVASLQDSPKDLLSRYVETDPQHHDTTEGSPDNGCLTLQNMCLLQHCLEAQQLAAKLVVQLTTPDEDCDSYTAGEREGDVVWDDGNPKSVREMKAKDADEEMEENVEKEVVTSPGEEAEGMDVEDASEWMDVTDQSSEMRRWAVEASLYQHLLKMLQCPSEEQIQCLGKSKYSHSVATLLVLGRIESLFSLDALGQVLSLADLGGAGAVCGLYKQLFQNFTEDSDPVVSAAKSCSPSLAIDLVEATAGAMRALIDKLTAGDSLPTEHILEEMKALCSLRSGDEGVLMNVVQMLSYFGRLLVNSDDKELLCREEVAGGLQQTTNFILDLCVSDGRLPVMATCLDVIIDLYTEDNTHVLAHHCRLLERLRGAYTKFMQAYRKGKKQYSAHTALLKTVVENMPNFIAYKEPRVRNVDPKGKHPAKQDKKTANKTS